jgi:hypothetical protein
MNFSSQGSVSSTLTRLMVFSDCPLCRSIAGSAIVKKPEWQSLREVQRDQQRDLLRAGHRRSAR